MRALASLLLISLVGCSTVQGPTWAERQLICLDKLDARIAKVHQGSTKADIEAAFGDLGEPGVTTTSQIGRHFMETVHYNLTCDRRLSRMAGFVLMDGIVSTKTVGKL